MERGHEGSASERESERNPFYEEEEEPYREDVRNRTRGRISRTELLGRIEVLENVITEFNTALVESRRTQEAMSHEIQALRHLVNSGNQGGGSSSVVKPKVKVREPDTYDGERDDKVLGSFFFDMQEYLDNIPGLTDAEQVRTAARYLIGNAKLWWRTRAEDRAVGRPVVEIRTWMERKQKLKDQFLPGNSSWTARSQLMTLRQTGTISEYVKAFFDLMLEIPDMTENDRKFNFMKGLHNWAQEELRRARVKTLEEAVQEAGRLMDFRTERTDRPRSFPSSSQGGNKGKQSSRSHGGSGGHHEKSKGKTSYHRSGGGHQKGRHSGGSGGSSSGGSYSPRKNRHTQKKSGSHSQKTRSATFKCYLCSEPGHLARDCPQRKLEVNAIRGDSGSDAPSIATVGGMRLFNSTLEDYTPEELEQMEGFIGRIRGKTPKKEKEVTDDSKSRSRSQKSATPPEDEDYYLATSSDKSGPSRRITSGSKGELAKINATSKYVDTDGKNRRLYLAKWANRRRCTWELAESMGEYADKVQEFFERKKKETADIKMKRQR
nr:hypothetical protein [Nostoc sp. ChiQUE02]MDZ8232074.1 hypothetical protein [Nostoc sp. ChiQUE02]